MSSASRGGPGRHPPGPLRSGRHRLMPEDVAFFRGRHVAVVEMEIGAANARGGTADDGVGRIDNGGIGDIVDADIPGLVPDECLHAYPLRRLARTVLAVECERSASNRARHDTAWVRAAGSRSSPLQSSRFQGRRRRESDPAERMARSSVARFGGRAFQGRTIPIRQGRRRLVGAFEEGLHRISW